MSTEEQQRIMEIEAIRRRIAHLISTDQISVPDKIAITKSALEIIERDAPVKEGEK